MNARNTVSLVIFLGIALWAASACSSAVPTATPLPAATFTALPPTATPTDTPSPTPTPANPEQILRTAYQRLQPVSHHIEMSMTLASNFENMGVPANQVQTLTTVQGDINGKDAHLRIGGYLINPLAPDAEKTLEIIVKGYKTYLHGPAATFDAPEDKWYVLPDAVGNSNLTTLALELLDHMADDVTGASQVATESLDGLECQVYTRDRLATINSFAKMLNQTFSSEQLGRIDEADTRFWVCADGYLHQIKMTIAIHNEDNPAQKSYFDTIARFSAIDRGIAITAPTDAAAIPTPSFGATMTAEAYTNATAEAQANAEATATAQAAQTVISAAADWPVALTDWTDENPNRWDTGNSDGELATAQMTLADNKYRWDVIAKDGVVLRRNPRMAKIGDFYLTADAQLISGSKHTVYGLIFRDADDQGYYIFRAADDGTFSVSRSQNGWHRVINDTRSSAIHPGAVNRLGVLAQGSRFIFLINDQYVGQADDTGVDKGTIGVAIEADAGETAVVEFSNLTLRVPPSEFQPTPNAAQLTATADAASSSAEQAAAWRVVLADDFSQNTHNWPLDDSSEAFGPAHARLTNGKYIWTIETRKDVLYSENPPQLPLVDDFYLTAQARQLDGPRQHDYGVVFRLNEGSYYAFRILDDRSFVVDLYRNGLTNLIPATRSDAIHADQPNKLTVVGRDSHFTFFINDKYVGELDDSRLPRGTAGIAFGLAANETGAFEFDNFQLRAPKTFPNNTLTPTPTPTPN
jgi:hypothetical protein